MPGSKILSGLPRRSGQTIPQVKFELFGNWDQAIRTFQKLGPEMKQAGLKAQMLLAREIVKRVKGHLRNQDLHWPGLDPQYEGRKRSAGRDGRILISSGEYYYAIEAWKSGNNHLVFAGVKRGKYSRNLKGKKSRLEIAQIAYLHEFSRGTRFPRRPLWNPTLREMGGAKGIKKFYVDYVYNELIKKGIRVIKKNIF